MFHLGANDSSSSSSSFLTAYLKNGSLIAAIGNATDFSAISSASRVVDGVLRSLTVSYDGRKLELVVDEATEADGGGEIDIPKKELFYVGGMKKKSGGRRKRAADKSDLVDIVDFKGRLFFLWIFPYCPLPGMPFQKYRVPQGVFRAPQGPYWVSKSGRKHPFLPIQRKLT